MGLTPVACLFFYSLCAGINDMFMVIHLRGDAKEQFYIGFYFESKVRVKI